MAQSIGRRRRLSVDRCVRLWGIVEHISRHAGLGRAELAGQFSLSERQLQADLNVIRDHMGLPLLRLQGYRFADAPPAAHALTLADLVALAPMIQQGLTDNGAQHEMVATLADRLPSLFLPSLHDLARAALVAPADHESIQGAGDFLLLAEAWLHAQPVRLNYLAGTAPPFAPDPIVVPNVVIRYEGSWYVVGLCYQLGRAALFCLDAVTAISPIPPA